MRQIGCLEWLLHTNIQFSGVVATSLPRASEVFHFLARRPGSRRLRWPGTMKSRGL